RDLEQPGVHADLAARQREGVGRVVGEHRRFPSAAAYLRRQRSDQVVDDAADVRRLARIAGLLLLRLEFGEGFRAELVELRLRHRTDVLGSSRRRCGGGAGGHQRGDGQGQHQALHGTLRFRVNGRCSAAALKGASSDGYTSRLATLSALSSMNSRRGSTTSPIRVLKIWSAATASSIFTCSRRRVSGLTVVSHSCSGFISPRPLKRWIWRPFFASSSNHACASAKLATAWVRLPRTMCAPSRTRPCSCIAASRSGRRSPPTNANCGSTWMVSTPMCRRCTINAGCRFSSPAWYSRR